MNEKLINSLMWKAGAKFEMMNWVHYDDFDYEKFAELLIEECVNAVENLKIQAEHQEAMNSLINVIIKEIRAVGKPVKDKEAE